MMYQKKRRHTSYKIIINKLIAGVAVALYGDGILTCEISISHNIPNLQLKHDYATYILINTNSDSKDLALNQLNKLVDNAIVNRDDLNIEFKVNRDAFYIKFDEFSEKVTLVNDYTKHANKKYVYIIGKNHYDFRITQSDEEVIEYLIQYELGK